MPFLGGRLHQECSWPDHDPMLRFLSRVKGAPLYTSCLLAPIYAVKLEPPTSSYSVTVLLRLQGLFSLKMCAGLRTVVWRNEFGDPDYPYLEGTHPGCSSRECCFCWCARRVYVSREAKPDPIHRKIERVERSNSRPKLCSALWCPQRV